MKEGSLIGISDFTIPNALLSSKEEKFIKVCGPGPIAEQDWGVTTAPLAGGKTFYLHVLKNPGAVLEIPVARKSRIKSVAALADGSALPFKKVGANLFITLPAGLPAQDYVISVTMR